ncbi:hypothetical protein [Algoriphagus winogradskyi]|uniref:Uncharacterized protein n=1 Tax=Algoriphagus winogradskyi TaxID=237017 RepID=A0ABY1NXS0_9BACT|nr:hypothetical protein [Algoriphagus winogradskyi]SMP21208.1 hypothetical protein SAMN06265367_103245 [Algoriphagus winogradskyi]
MYSRIARRIVSISIPVLFFGTASGQPTPGIDQKDKGFIVVEAEDFFMQSKTDKRKWEVLKKQTTSEGLSHQLETASNNSYIEVLPDTRITHEDELIQGENFSNEAGEMAIVSYEVNFTNPGRYYVWVRAYSTGSEDNGIHVGIDGSWPESGQRMQWCEGKNAWTWGNRQRTKEEHCGVPHQIYLDVEAAGDHIIQFSMREDGFEFDQFLLTQDINYVPDSNSNEATIAPPVGRIAIVADGNSPDPDDLGGTGISLALLRAAGLTDRLVHYSHSCDLVRGERISQKAEKERHHMMQIACDVTARRWGGYDSLIFFDALWQQEETVSDLAKAINESTSEDPLWIVEAGEPDIIGMALKESNPEKHQFVKVITHHPANDDAGDFYTWAQILDFGVEEVRIPDQNEFLKVDLEHWDWAKNHPDSRVQWIWLLGKMAEVDDVVKFQKGKWDCSDAGMVLYWITGATSGGLEQGKVEDVQKLLLDYISDNPDTV